MALVRSFKPVEGAGRKHPTDVECGYSIFPAGEDTILQLQTYGSDGRESEPKVSQTLQFQRAAAIELLQILASYFAHADH